VNANALKANVCYRVHDSIVALFSIVAAQCGWSSSLSSDVGYEDLVEATVDSSVPRLCLYFTWDCVDFCCLCGGFICDSFVHHVEKRIKEDNDSELFNMFRGVFFGDRDVYRIGPAAWAVACLSGY
jgi:hypothetical protein